MMFKFKVSVKNYIFIFKKLYYNILKKIRVINLERIYEKLFKKSNFFYKKKLGSIYFYWYLLMQLKVDIIYL